MYSENKKKWVFRLFISGRKPATEITVEMLNQICEKNLNGMCTIKVINVIENPAAAMKEGIIATPTLLKKFPKPEQRIIGDFSINNKVLSLLEIIVHE